MHLRILSPEWALNVQIVENTVLLNVAHTDRRPDGQTDIQTDRHAYLETESEKTKLPYTHTRISEKCNYGQLSG